jgi:hypothetical protein
MKVTPHTLFVSLLILNSDLCGWVASGGVVGDLPVNRPQEGHPA